MSSVTDFTLIHTCENKGSKALVKERAPFRAESKPIPYLGQGHYFWQEEKNIGILWGKMHYPKRKFFVCECVVSIENDNFLDLLRPEHRSYLRQLALRFDAGKWKLGKLIETLREADKKEPGIFDFNFIRARDDSKRDGKNYNEKLTFSEEKAGYMLTGLGWHIISMNEKVDGSLKSIEIVHEG